jgi:hypothetical protein
MATVTELWEGRSETVSTDRPRLQVPYVVTEAADEDEVKTAIAAQTPTAIGTMKRASYQVEERVDATTWKASVSYEKPEFDPEAPEPVITFDTSGGTQHITQSISTRASYGNNPPDFKGAIGFDGEQVQGVDITVPVFNFSETHYRETVDASYFGVLFRLTGKVNSDAFRGFDPGECLFLGATGSKRGDGAWEISYKFAASENKTGLTVGDIGGIDKPGWDYLWIRYANDVDGAANALVKKPVAVYVEQVYEEDVFADLALDPWP